MYESRKREATVNKYELIEFITVCAALEATGDPDSALTLHSQFKLLSLSYLRYCSLTEYTVKDVLYSHRKYYTSTTSACTEFSPGPGGRGAKEGGAGSEARFCLYDRLSLGYYIKDYLTPIN